MNKFVPLLTISVLYKIDLTEVMTLLQQRALCEEFPEVPTEIALVEGWAMCKPKKDGGVTVLWNRDKLIFLLKEEGIHARVVAAFVDDSMSYYGVIDWLDEHGFEGWGDLLSQATMDNVPEFFYEEVDAIISERLGDDA